MLSWRNRAVGLLRGVIIVLSIVYPFAVLAAGTRISSLTFVAVACVLFGLRAIVRPPKWIGALRWPAVSALALIVVLALLDGAIAAKAYPAIVSGGFLLMFGISLWRTPSLVERIAKLQGEVLSPEASLYCWRVTMVWTVWLMINTVTAATLALIASVEAWALWTGLAFYIITGVIFGGELLFRRRLQRKRTIV